MSPVTQIVVLCCVTPKHVVKVEGRNKLVDSKSMLGIATNCQLPTHNCRQLECGHMPRPFLLLAKGLVPRLDTILVLLT